MLTGTDDDAIALCASGMHIYGSLSPVPCAFKFECLPHTHAHNLNAHGTGEAWNRGYIYGTGTGTTYQQINSTARDQLQNCPCTCGNCPRRASAGGHAAPQDARSVL